MLQRCHPHVLTIHPQAHLDTHEVHTCSFACSMTAQEQQSCTALFACSVPCRLQSLQGLLTWGGFLLVTRPGVAVLCQCPAQDQPSLCFVCHPAVSHLCKSLQILHSASEEAF